jgi:hypothetical protein
MSELQKWAVEAGRKIGIETSDAEAALAIQQAAEPILAVVRAVAVGCYQADRCAVCREESVEGKLHTTNCPVPAALAAMDAPDE